MEVDTALHLTREAVEIVDKVEAYEICGHSLREAYVGLKRMRQDNHHPAGVSTATSPGDVRSHPADNANAEDLQLQEVESKLGPSVLSDLQNSIAQDGFANKVQRARACPHSDDGSEELDELLGTFVVVTKEDALDAMASYLAAWLSSVPEAQNMDPKKLQCALLSTVKELKKSRIRQILSWGRCAYRGATFAYTAFTVYENPWLVRAVVSALWSAGTVLCTML